MPAIIEIITSKKNLLTFIERAIEPLNRVQQEYIFQLANSINLERAYLFDRQLYTTEEVFKWMRMYREAAKGYRPYIILVIDKPLNGQLINLFGSHRANEGFAVFTTQSFDPKYEQFLYDIVRFCRYYFARYLLSFIEPSIKSHETRGCMFDKKLYKPDIIMSLASGNICSECSLKLEPKYNIEIKDAVENVLRVVSNQQPVSLVMKGGGVKGLALAGALQELQKNFTFNTFSGTSAGAIAATLLGVGYKPDELQAILEKTDFNTFKDASVFKGLINLIFKGGYYPGTKFKLWLNTLLKTKLYQKEGDIRMKDLPLRTIVYASSPGVGVLRFDSTGERKESIAAFATRCSMSIPGFFVPTKVDDYDVYDGGLGHNFPLRIFIEDNKTQLFIGLYIKSPVSEFDHFAKKMIDIVTDSDERVLVNKYRDKIVVIDPHPISTTDFNLCDEKKKFLVLCGRVGALQYLRDFCSDASIDKAQLSELEKQLEQQRNKFINN